MDIDLNRVFGRCVTVAGRPLGELGAAMQAGPTVSRIRDVETFQGRRRSTILPIKNLITGMRLTARIDFVGSNEDRAMAQSSFEALFRSQTETVEIDILDGFRYSSVLLSSADCGTVGELITTVEYVWAVTRHKDPVAVVLRESNTIFCASNVDQTDCVITVDGGIFEMAADAGFSTVSISLNGLDWYIPTSANPDCGDLVLDGVNKTYSVDGANVVSAVSWTDFPFLVPGSNTLNVFIGGVPLPQSVICGKCEYTPTFL